MIVKRMNNRFSIAHEMYVEILFLIRKYLFLRQIE